MVTHDGDVKDNHNPPATSVILREITETKEGDEELHHQSDDEFRFSKIKADELDFGVSSPNLRGFNSLKERSCFGKRLGSLTVVGPLTSNSPAGGNKISSFIKYKDISFGKLGESALTKELKNSTPPGGKLVNETSFDLTLDTQSAKKDSRKSERRKKAKDPKEGESHKKSSGSSSKNSSSSIGRSSPSSSSSSSSSSSILSIEKPMLKQEMRFTGRRKNMRNQSMFVY